MALADTARLATVLTLKDGLSPGLSKSIKTVDRFDKGLGRAGKGVGTFAKGVGKAAVGVAAFAGVGLAASAKAAIDWEDAFQGVVKTLDASDAEFDRLREDLRGMAREMPITANELAGIAEAGGAMGIKAKDIKEFTRTVAILGTTTNVAAEDAATALGQLGNSINLRAKDYKGFAAALVALGNAGNSTEAQILDITKRAGAFAKIARLNRRETLGWAAATANIFGDNQEAGGTALAKFFRGMTRAFNKGNKTLQKLLGLSAKELRQTFARDSSDAIQTFIEKLGELKGAARDDVVSALFKDGQNVGRLVNSLADNIDGNLVPSLNNANKAWKDGSAAEQEFAKRNATVKSALARLKNNVVDAAISIGEGFAPALGRAADKLSKFLSQDANRSKLKELGADIGKAIDGIDFDKLINGAQNMASALKPALAVLLKILEGISKLPPEVIGVGGAAIITDKLSGGALSSGAGGAVGGLAESLAKTLATKIPLFGKAFVQPVFVTNMGGLPGGGKTPPVPVGGAALPAVGAVATLDIEMFHREFAVPMLTKIGHEGGLTRSTIRATSNTEAANERGEQAKVRATLAANVAKVSAVINTSKNALTANERGEQAKARSKLDALRDKQQASINAFREGERATLGGINSSKNAITSRLSTANERLAQIRAKRMSFTTHVTAVANVSVRNVNNTTKTYTSYGGSRTMNTAI